MDLEKMTSPCTDPLENYYCQWTAAEIEFEGLGKSIDFTGAANKFGFDDIQLIFPSTEPTEPTPDPTSPTSISGDPHIATWSGFTYDFHGGCDLVMVHNPTFNNGQGLEM